ncbi:MAG: hypothetical protein ACRELC_14060 [Gemmatimonadota bacterium]
MRARKWFATMVSVVILGFQLLVIVPSGPLTGTWYWPFTDYTMYASANREGDTVAVRRLLVIPCDSSAPARELGFSDLRGWPSWFQLRLGRIAADGDTASARRRDAAIAVVDERIGRYLFGEFCHAELWEKTMRLSRDLSGARSVPWTLARRWTIARERSGVAAGERADPAEP